MTQTDDEFKKEVNLISKIIGKPMSLMKEKAENYPNVHKRRILYAQLY